MINKIKSLEVHSLLTIMNFKPLPNTLLIRIFDSGKKEIMIKENPLSFKKDFKMISVFEFDDIDISFNPFKVDNSKTEQELIFENAISDIKAIVFDNIDVLENIVVHCHMGESRSRAVYYGLLNKCGLFSDYKIVTTGDMKKLHPSYNKYVYSLF